MNNQPIDNKPDLKENFLKEIITFTILAFVIVIPIRTYVAQPFIVSGPSMDPTFASNQYIIVDRLTYNFHEPERNDVIIFKYPRDPKTFYIKRIIGLPGESLSVSSGKITVTNSENPKGFLVDDSYISEKHKTYENFMVTLGPNEYYVMGDNRAESSDSRTWGPLDSKFIVGRPFVRLFPVAKASFYPGQK